MPWRIHKLPIRASKFLNMWSVKLRILTLISPRRKFSGMCSVFNWNSRSTGSAGLNRCRRWLAALARFTGFGKLGHGSSVSSSISTLLTIADAGLNKFATASFFVFAVIRAAKPAPTCPGWLCGVGPKISSPEALSTTVALQTLPYRENIKCNNITSTIFQMYYVNEYFRCIT